ncbi:UNVERIFIED_CONTAM: hypothetical protein NCL1_54958 [Trichonephila clavipes]
MVPRTRQEVLHHAEHRHPRRQHRSGPGSPRHPGRHEDHPLHPRHLAPPPVGRPRCPRRARLPYHGHRMAPHHLLQRARQVGRRELREGHEGPGPGPHPLHEVDRCGGRRPLRLRDHRREGRLPQPPEGGRGRRPRAGRQQRRGRLLSRPTPSRRGKPAGPEAKVQG